MRRAFMPFYIGDYLGDTGHLNTLQHGAYCLLLFAYWRAGSLPNDEKKLQNISRMTPTEWRKNRTTLQAFFHDGWKHRRVDAELKKMAEISIKRAAAGSKGGTIAMINRYRKT